MPPLFAELRHKIAIGKVGRLFGKDHLLYKHAMRDPSALFRFIAKVDMDRAAYGGKLDADKFVMKNAKELFGNITPAEQKQIIDILEKSFDVAEC